MHAHSYARIGRALVVLVVAASGLGIGASAARATWSDQNCSGSGGDMPTWRRSQAKNYAERADNEGYEWGGGCFKLNDRDDTPGAPDSGGEGTDCSGLVFKTWAFRLDGSAGYRYWDHDKEIHGPYSTDDYFTPAAGQPFRSISKGYGSTMYMDAFVYRNASDTAGHIGMIYSEGGGGSDFIIESKGDVPGTGVFLEDYRSQSSYKGVQRKNWTPDCYPKCTSK